MQSYALRGLFGHACLRKGWPSGGDDLHCLPADIKHGWILPKKSSSGQMVTFWLFECVQSLPGCGAIGQERRGFWRDLPRLLGVPGLPLWVPKWINEWLLQYQEFKPGRSILKSCNQHFSWINQKMTIEISDECKGCRTGWSEWSMKGILDIVHLI